MEIFDLVSEKGLTPNQYYLLCSMRDSVTPVKINIHLELRHLISEQWVTKDNKLTAKAHVLIDSIERLFIVAKKKTSLQLMGQDFKQNIITYRDKFPNKKLPSGKAARSSPKNLETVFRWFFDNYNYDWDTIFKATDVYVNECLEKGDKFMRTSQYFVRKNNLSDLADMCEAISTDGYTEAKANFNTRVV